MAAGLYRDEPVFRREVDRAADLLAKRLGVDLRPLLFPKQESSATTGGGVDLRAMLGRKAESGGTVGELGRTGLAQPALFVVEYALARLLESWGVKPAALLGYSLGEYVAACLAGVFSLEDALLLVAERARLIEGLPAGAMLAVPLPEADVLALVAESGGQLSLAAVNGPSLAVVAGSPDAVATLAKRLGERGVTTRPLQTSHAFHSWMMEPIAALVTELASTITLRAPSVPLVSNVTGTWMTAEQATDPSYWASHLCRPVRFAAGLCELWRERSRALVEVGPGQSLGSLAVQQAAEGDGETGPVLASLRHVWDRQEDGAFLLQALGKLWLSGCKVDWAGFRGSERRRRVPLPTYPFERQRYWIEARETEARAAVRPDAAGETRPSLPAAATPGAARPRLHARPSLRNAYVAPDTELGRAVSGLWREILGIETIGLHDNFFELGGHSLLGTHLMNLVREVLGVDLPLRAIFETPTVAGMAQAVAAARAERKPEGPVLAPVPRGEGPLQLSFAQSRMWFLARFAPRSPAYNVPYAVRLSGEVRPAVLSAAVAGIVRRHEALRTRFPEVEGKPVQRIARELELPVPHIDLTALPRAVRERESGRLADLSASLPFDLATGPLLRVTLVDLDRGEHDLFLCMHHIVSDGWSLGLFLGEMATLYDDIRHGRPSSRPAGSAGNGGSSGLPALRVQYADFAGWQRRWLSGAVLDEHLGYWRQKLAGRPAALDLPLDRPRGELSGSGVDRSSLRLAEATAAALQALAEREGATPFVLFLALWSHLLGRICRQDDVIVGSPIANRTRAEITDLIGFFVNTLVLRTDLSGDPPFRGLLKRVG
ncbi:MAG TPA: condensation domain-containing protein, partial [Thermoanaerobaculia bacterium]